MSDPTVLAQILARWDQVLKAALAGSATVDRDRADAVCLEEAPFVNVLVQEVPSTRFSDTTDRDEAHIDLRIYVRDDDPTMAAEAIHQIAHKALMADVQQPQPVAALRRISASFELQAADTTSLIKTVRYRAQYLTPATTL